MPNQQSLKMEDMSEAYLRALCAANGYNVTRGGHDNDGYDVMIDCKGKVAEDSIVYSPKVEVQLKSSYSKIVENEDGSITYPLEVKNYKWLIDQNRMIPLILIVFHMHEDEEMWLEQTPDWLKITKCAYWISLEGLPDTNNQNTISIKIPSENILTKDTLREIMRRVSKQEAL